MHVIKTVRDCDICRVMYAEEPHVLEKIVELQEYLPVYLREKKERIHENLMNERGIHMVLRCSVTKEIICYMFALPQDERVLADYVHDDRDMPLRQDQFYIDQIVAKEDAKKGLLFATLAFTLFDEANKVGVYRFAVHALCCHGLDKVLMRIYRKYVTDTRFVVMPSYGNEKYLYMEAFYQGRS